MATRILLADDHALVRRGLRLILDGEPDLEVVSEASDGVEAVAAALRENVDVAILDVSMPLITGLHAARRLVAHRPQIKVVMLSVHDDEQFFLDAMDAGASGYVLKTAAADDLVAAVRAAMRGERPQVDEHAPRDALTTREEEVVKLIAEGHKGREIAQVLSISENTVERHRQNVFEKLRLRNRVELTRYAVRRGLVEP